MKLNKFMYEKVQRFMSQHRDNLGLSVERTQLSFKASVDFYTTDYANKMMIEQI